MGAAPRCGTRRGKTGRVVPPCAVGCPAPCRARRPAPFTAPDPSLRFSELPTGGRRSAAGRARSAWRAGRGTHPFTSDADPPCSGWFAVAKSGCIMSMAWSSPSAGNCGSPPSSTSSIGWSIATDHVLIAPQRQGPGAVLYPTLPPGRHGSADRRGSQLLRCGSPAPPCSRVLLNKVNTDLKSPLPQNPEGKNIHCTMVLASY